MESLGIDLRLIIIQIVNFGLLLFLLTRFLYKPILKILNQRKEKIAQSLALAQQIDEEKLKLEERKKSELRKAREDGIKMAQELKDQGEKERAEIIGRAKKEVERLIEKSKEQVNLEREKARQELKSEIADLVLATAEKLLAERMSPGDREKFLASSLKTLKATGASDESLFAPQARAKMKASPQAEKIASEFLLLLRKTKNMSLLPQIVAKLEDFAFILAEVTTSSDLKSEEQQRIQNTLEKIFGKGLKIKFSVNPKIIGGMVVKIGDKVFDSSLLGRAQKLRDSV